MNNTHNKTTLILFLILISTLSIWYRFADMPYNFTPIGALALFAGYALRSRWSFCIPIGVMAFTDAIIGTYNPGIMVTVYGSYMLMTLLGGALAQNPHWMKPFIGSVAGSVLFFVLTNGAVWAFGSWYPHNTAGLYECFLNALPFFRNTLSGNVFYTFFIFSSYNMITSRFIHASITRSPRQLYVTN
jgi:hypothetical protein